MTATGWRLVARVAKDRFALGEPVLLRLEALWRGPGSTLAPELQPGRPGSPVLEVRRDGGETEEVRTDDFDLSVPRRTSSAEVSRGMLVEGSLDVRAWVKPLAAGSYEVVAALPEKGVRSEPVRFVVERLNARGFALEASDAGREGPRSLLCVDDRGDGARLLLERPLEEGWIASDLAPVGKLARVLLATAWDAAEPRRWAVALEGNELRRIYVDGPRVVERPAIPIEVTAPLPLAAVLGASTRPSPPGLHPIPDPEGGVRETWPALHVALAGRRVRRSVVLGLTLRPQDDAATRADEASLGSPAIAGTALALAPDRRRIVVVREDEGTVHVEALEWTAAGLGPVRVVIAHPGRFLSLDALAEGDVVRVALLVARGPLLDELELLEATVDSEHPGAPLRSRAFSEVPPGVVDLRVRVGPGGRTHVLGVQAPPGRPALLEVGSREVSTIDAAALPWDTEVEGEDVFAVVLSRELGPVRRTFPARAPARATD